MRGLAGAVLATVLVLTGTGAQASGGGDPYDNFVSRGQPDSDLGDYDRGALGIVLPSYPRVFLYPAWRAMVRSPAAANAAPAAPGSVPTLRDICCDRATPFWDSTDPNIETGPGRWLAVRRAVNPHAPRVQPELMLDGDRYDILNCPYPAWTAAGDNLQRLQASPDATPGRLQAWVAAQDAVFEFCSYREGAKPRYGKTPAPRAELPLALPAGEPLVWRQWRDYQIAAAHFYAGHHAEAEARFLAIGAQSGHPMQRWGAYLALRARIRAASLDNRWEEQRSRLRASLATNADKAAPVRTVEQARQAIQVGLSAIDNARLEWLAARHAEVVAIGRQLLALPDQQAVHADVRALLRVAAAKLVPMQRLRELSDELDQVDADPYAHDTLGDWVLLADSIFDNADLALMTPLRERHEWFDWMRTLQGCPDSQYDTARVPCVVERAHAMQRWTESQKAGHASAAAWLVAALSTAERPTPALLQAAAQVGEREPQYLTVQYHALRLLRSAGQMAAARELGDRLLQQRLQSVSALNLIRAERFAAAENPGDAARYLLRRVAVQSDPDTGKSKPPEAAGPLLTRIHQDGLNWLNQRLGTAELLQLADASDLTPAVASAVAQSAWWRADLLGQQATALAAARWVQAHTPRLAASAKAYQDAGDAASRRHVLMLASLTERLSPMIVDVSAPYQRFTVTREEATASGWCFIGADPQAKPAAGVPREGDGPAVLPASARGVAAELVRLSRVGTATAFLGAHVIRRLAIQPADPDLPWLLAVTVWSTKGGCVGPDNGQLSRRAWNELHTRFKTDPWAAATPYWYK